MIVFHYVMTMRRCIFDVKKECERHKDATDRCIEHVKIGRLGSKAVVIHFSAESLQFIPGGSQGQDQQGKLRVL